MTLQEALKRLRFELGLTQEDLAGKIGKTCLTVNRWENGKGFPSRNNAKEIISVAKRCGASRDCVAYLREVLMPETKRTLTAAQYGFPNIDRDFLLHLADEASVCIYVINAKTYELLYVNRSAEAAAAKYLTEMGEPTDDRRLAEQADKRCFHFFANQSEPCSFCPLGQFGRGSFTDKTVIIPFTGRIQHIHAKTAKIHGQKVYVLYLTDITENEAERDALYEMTNDIPVGVGIYHIYLDDSIKLAFMNTVFYQMIGEERHEALLKNELSGFHLIHPNDKGRLMAEIKAAIQGMRDIELDIRMRVRDRKYHPIHLSARLLKKDHEKFTFYCRFYEQRETPQIEAESSSRKGETE